jgi:hypothetical protein
LPGKWQLYARKMPGNGPIRHARQLPGIEGAYARQLPGKWVRMPGKLDLDARQCGSQPIANAQPVPDSYRKQE